MTNVTFSKWKAKYSVFRISVEMFGKLTVKADPLSLKGNWKVLKWTSLFSALQKLLTKLRLPADQTQVAVIQALTTETRTPCKSPNTDNVHIESSAWFVIFFSLLSLSCTHPVLDIFKSSQEDRDVKSSLCSNHLIFFLKLIRKKFCTQWNCFLSN